MDFDRTSFYTVNPTFTCLENLPVQADDLYLVYCGRENCRSGHRFGPNRRRFHLIHFIKVGKGCLEIGGQKFDLHAGDAFWLPPGEEAWYEADAEEPWTYSWIGFDGLSATTCIRRSGFTKERPFLSIPHLTEELCARVDRMMDAHQLTFSCGIRRNALLLDVMGLLISAAEEKDGSEASYAYSGAVYAQYARNYIDLHFAESIRVGELADYIGVNRSYLTSSFKQLMGMSIQDYILGLRMNRARTLLRNTDLKINEIAQMVGYDDVLSFSKIFKSRAGMSPTSYRDVEHSLVQYSEKTTDLAKEGLL